MHATEELHYQALIKRHLRTILSISAFIVICAAGIEVKSYYQSQQQKAAQIQFEQYLEKPDAAITHTLQTQYPSLIQTQLASLLAAKESFVQDDMPQTVKHLQHVITYTSDQGLKKIATQRLAVVHRHLGNMDKAQTILQTLAHDSDYSQLQLALSSPTHSDERMDALTKAMDSATSPYVSQLIAIAQYDNLDAS
jgi:predicted negative regulator of RcsB-dependent stress response